MNAPAVSGSKGPVKLGKQLGKGAEGAVFEVIGDPGLVAKIYLEAISPARAEKLRVMPQLLTPKLAALTAWPRDVLHSSNGQVAGFLMPRVDAQDVHNVYGPKTRHQHFPQADWRLLVRTALNMARAFAVVHSAGYVVGDVNHGGVMVSGDATVRLIDCDSFQITTGTKTFFCEVGVPDFTPPELQGAPFRGVTRTINHDNFGVAILVFRLLMLGRHPFAGRHQGKDLGIDEAIGLCKYAFSREKSRTLMEPPPFCPPTNVAGQEIALLWEQAFSPAGKQPKGRPTAEQWVHALTKVEANFAKCTVHPGHYFGRGISCPWCPIQRTGASPFPLPAGHAPPIHAGGPFSLEAVWAQITSVSPPPDVQPPVQAITLPPSKEARTNGTLRSLLIGLGVAAAAIVFIAALANDLELLWSAVGAGVAYFMFASNAPTSHRLQYAERRKAAEAELARLTNRWAAEASVQPFSEKLNALRLLRDEWQNLPASRQSQYQRLVANRDAAARLKFLDAHEIETASITGIGRAKKAVLQSFGIETAADVDKRHVMNVPGFGPAWTSKLLGWRREVEAKYRPNPTAGVDPQDIAALDQSIATRKRELEDALRKGAAELHQVKATLLSRRQALEGPMRAAAAAMAQAHADTLAAG